MTLTPGIPKPRGDNFATFITEKGLVNVCSMLQPNGVRRTFWNSWTKVQSSVPRSNFLTKGQGVSYTDVDRSNTFRDVSQAA
jgi:hypothetical protein